MDNSPAVKNPLNIIVIVSALGYFVDIYDLILFSIVRVASLNSIGIIDKEAIYTQGAFLINMQMTGMLVGGILWGIMGDRKGRISVLFGSIILYSIANFANGFVTDVSTYGWLRFIAGIGLAGELGAGITLVSETMDKEHRGYGTMVVVSFGVLGAVLAALVGKYGSYLTDFFFMISGKTFEAWRIAYFVGGILGILLLILRFGVYESGMYKKAKASEVTRGNFLKLFSSWKRFIKYLSCITVGIPIWFSIGILITFSPEICSAIGMDIKVDPGFAVMYFYLGTSFGDFLSGYLSQLFKNRKKIIAGYLVLMVILFPIYLFGDNLSLNGFYIISALLGLASGYWAVFILIASEQFGTDIRSTVTTTVPNFVRGSLPLLVLGFTYFKETAGIINSALIVGAFAVAIAFLSLYGIQESYGKDLDYVEED
jgi:MFS transporter, putative metabolite:H+ symporter